MPWHSKEQPTPFDATPVRGLWFLDGDQLAQTLHQERLRGQAYPLLTLPSGLERELTPSDHVHLFGALTLPRRASRDAAYAHILPLAEEHGYEVLRLGASHLVVADLWSDRNYRIHYDDRTRELTNIERFPHHAMDLLPGHLRAALPPLYSNEHLGLRAAALAKFFTPDSGWTWYAIEFDGEDVFFGLVSGFEIELGYFTLAELERVRGPLGLPIERDLWFEPQSLRELQVLEEKLKGL